MSRDSPQDLPAELREAIEQEAGGEFAHESTRALEDLWVRLGSTKPPDSALPDASDTWSEVRRHLDAELETTDDAADSSRSRVQRSSRAKRRWRTGWHWAVAAAVLLIAVLGVWLWQRPITVSADPGRTASHTLPDGSSIELNGDSRLTYSRTLSTFDLLEDQRRTLRLQGEAYVEVQSAERPFVVRTSTAQIEATGTAFAVQSDPDKTHITLAEGSVRVQGRAAPNQAVTLNPGEAVLVGQAGPLSPPSDTSIQRVTAWRRGGFAVTAEPLSAIAQALERQFGTPITLSPDLSTNVASSPLTLYYSQNVKVETILHDIAMARGLSYRSTAQNGYVLGPADRAHPPSGASKQP